MLVHGPIGGAPISSTPHLEVSATLPEILLQSVVIRGDRTSEGHIIEAVAPAWRAILDIIKRRPEEMFAIPASTWEEIIAGAYERAGFDKVILTPRSGDRGRDVIAEKTGWGSVRFIDQVKAYKPGHLVTVEEVRALASCCWRITPRQRVSCPPPRNSLRNSPTTRLFVHIYRLVSSS